MKKYKAEHKRLVKFLPSTGETKEADCSLVFLIGLGGAVFMKPPLLFFSSAFNAGFTGCDQVRGRNSISFTSDPPPCHKCAATTMNQPNVIPMSTHAPVSKKRKRTTARAAKAAEKAAEKGGNLHAKDMNWMCVVKVTKC